MRTKYRVKNFRCFDKEGVEFDLAPITILTGANGAGKSSLVKSLVVLNTYLSKNIVTTESNAFRNVIIRPSTDVPLSFSDGELKLGRFDNALNRECGDERKMTFEYEVDSKSLGCSVSVSLVFGSDDRDEINNGWLSSVAVKNDRNELVYFAEVDDRMSLHIRQLKLSWFKSRFVKAAAMECCKLWSERVDSDIHNGVSPDKSITDESILQDKITLSSLKKEVESRLSLEEKASFVEWYKKSKESDKLISFDIELFRLVGSTFQNNSLCLESSFINSLCELNVHDAIESIKSISLPKLDQKMVERVKVEIVESLINSSFPSFKDWYSSMEDSFLDEMRTPVIQAQKLKVSRDVVTFDDMVTLLYLADEEYQIKALKSPIDMISCQATQRYLDAFIDYVSQKALTEVLVPDFANSLKYIGSAQVSVQRLYNNQSGVNAFSDLILRYSEAKRNYKGIYACDTFLNKWIQAFEIGHSVTVKNAEGGLGLITLLHKVDGDEGSLLADEGYGITQLLSILLNIEVAILTAETVVAWEGEDYMVKTERSRCGNVLYLPQTLAIEEPENHLHPKLQSLLADMLCEAYEEYNIQFIVETHSEYLIRKSQVIVAKKGYASNIDSDRLSPFRTYYIPKNDKPYSLGYRKDGKFAESFGSGFFDEATKRVFEIL